VKVIGEHVISVVSITTQGDTKMNITPDQGSFDHDSFDHDVADPTTQFEPESLRAGLTAARRRTRRNQALVGGAAAVSFAAFVVGCLPRTNSTAKVAGQTTTTVAASPSSTTPTSDAGEIELDDAQEDLLDQQTDGPHGWPDQQNPPPVDEPEDAGDGADDPVDIPPGPEVEPTPCDFLASDGSSLVVMPDPVILDDNVMAGEFGVTNCSDGDVDFSTAVNPKVTLSTAGDTVLPGQTAVVGFDIDGEAYGNGAIQFKVKVSEPNHSHYVDVSAYNPLLGLEAVASNTITAGDGVGGCANDCIVSALLRKNLQSPNLALDVVTDTPATIRVYVSDTPPQIDDEGASFGDADPIDTSPAGSTEWTAQLQPLEADTTYYIILTATDADDDVSREHGSFHTVTPLDGPDGIVLESPGCGGQCITSAVLTPGADHTTKHLEVTTSTPATLQVSVDLDPPTFDGDVPSFDDADVWLNSGLELIDTWSTDIPGLWGDTDYHIIVRADDAEGRTSFRVGEFHTAKPPTVDIGLTLIGLTVDNDGDKVGRGELSFGWAVGEDDVAYKGESKVDDGEWVTFPTSGSYWPVHDYSVDGVLPTIYVAATERDYGGGFCSMGKGVPETHGSNGDCHYKWNVASSGIVFVDELDGLPSCTEFGLGEEWADFGCMSFASSPQGSDYPSITALVAVQVS
jgi:hypothetical protein